jgi:hypothetical protein
MILNGTYGCAGVRARQEKVVFVACEDESVVESQVRPLIGASCSFIKWNLHPCTPDASLVPDPPPPPPPSHCFHLDLRPDARVGGLTPHPIPVKDISLV